MADIVVSSKKKVNIFDRVIQSVVIMVNMNKMNRAIDEHLNVVNRAETDDKRIYEENILREIVFVKYQYNIMQRQMYELKIPYSDEIVDKINSTEKTDRLELQREFLEMEYDRVTRSKFKSREEVKYDLLVISSAIDAVKQSIKDEGKARRYNSVIKAAEEIDTAVQTEVYEENMYKEFFDAVDEYVGYINDNYDISKLPSDERELIEFVIETMIKGVESDIDKHLYEYKLVINICKNSYRYFKIIDKIFEKLQKIYDESLESGIIELDDYVKMFKDIYDEKIKTMVNDVHRTLKTEDEYFEYSKLLAAEDDENKEKLDDFILSRALETATVEKVKDIINKKLLSKKIVEEVKEPEIVTINEDIVEDIVLDKVKDKEDKKEENKENESKVRLGITKTIRKVGRPRKVKTEEEETKTSKTKKAKTVKAVKTTTRKTKKAVSE